MTFGYRAARHLASLGQEGHGAGCDERDNIMVAQRIAAKLTT
jgi:hypothetical protein